MGSRESDLPSVFNECNRTSEWAHRVWLMEERQSLPLLFDLSHGHRRCGASYSNVAIARVPTAVEEDALLVSIRVEPRRGRRLGKHNAVGILRSENLTRLLQQQPSLGITLPERPVDNLDILEFVPEIPKDVNKQHPLPSAKKYDRMLHEATKRHNIYQGVRDEDLWKRPLCCFPNMQDVRLFYRNTTHGMKACMVTVGPTKRGLHLKCLNHMHGKPGSLQSSSSNNISCPQVMLLATVSEEVGMRNNVPLVRSDGLAWPGYPSDLVWLMDTMGGVHGEPSIYSVNTNRRGSTAANATETRSLRDCEYMQGWRGNSPVVQFSDHLWMAIVHKYNSSKKSKFNPFGRTYYNKIVIFESYIPQALPRR